MPWILPTSPSPPPPPWSPPPAPLPSFLQTRLADDLVAAQQVFIDVSPDGSHEVLTRAIGAMFAQMEDYAAEPDEPDLPVVFVNIPNQALNPNFEHDQVGAAPGGFQSPAALTSWVVSSAWAMTGRQSLRLVSQSTGSPPVTCSLFLTGPEFGNVGSAPSGVWPAAPGQSIALRSRWKINSVPGAGSTVRMAWAAYDAAGDFLASAPVGETLAVAGQEIDVWGIATMPTGTAFMSLVLQLYVVTTGSLDASVDNIGVYFDPAGAVPAYTDPDIPGSGWEWTGLPGLSVSQPTPPAVVGGWSKLLDIDQADTTGLPYLAQYVGERITAGMSDAAARQQIRTNPNAARGTLQAVADGIMPLLSGTQSVFTKERSKLDGTVDPDWLAVQTYASETPNPTLVQQTIRNKLLGGDIMLDYSTLTRNTWATIEVGGPTWATIETGGKTWTQIETALGLPAGFTLWTP